MELTIDTPWLDDLEHAWKVAPEMVTREMTAATFEAELLLQREVQELTPVGVGGAGGLRGSIFAAAPEVSGLSVLGVVGSPLKYAEPVELGTKPHMPPLQPLLDWVHHKLGKSDKEAESVARRIQWHISHYGTPGAGMFHRAYHANLAAVQAIFARATHNIVRNLGAA